MTESRTSVLQSQRERRLELPRVGLELPVDWLLQHCYASEDDIVVASGTLVEGIGNKFSDVDVYVITPALPKAGSIRLANHHRVITKQRQVVTSETPADADVFLVHTVIPDTGIKIDVEFRTFDEIAKVGTRLESIYRYAVANLALLTMYLDERETLLLHRLFAGVAVHGQARFEQLLRDTLDRTHFLYVSYRWVSADFSDVLDILGAWSADEVERCLDLARENLILQMKGYLHLCGFSNPRRKWIASGLVLLPPEDDALKVQYLELCRLHGYSSGENWRAYVERSLDLCDALLARGASRLQELPGVPHGAAGLGILTENMRSATLLSEYASWEFDYRAKVYGLHGQPTRRLLERA